MKIPTELFLQGIEEKKVYYFSSTRLNTTEPHYYICIKRTDNDILILSCCTSQFDTVREYVETRCLPLSTLVWISSSDLENPFSKDTYVNCNQYHPYTLDEFKLMYDSDIINFSGKISDGHYEQIIIGIHNSPLIEPEIKELIPVSIN